MQETWIIEKESRKLIHENYTPLHYAAEYDLKEIGEILISKGADINAINHLDLRLDLIITFSLR